jgi:hypothetical protein
MFISDINRTSSDASLLVFSIAPEINHSTCAALKAKRSWPEVSWE